MTMDVDPRAWNIVAGLMLATGCGGRTIGVEGDETSDSDPTSQTTTGDECQSSSDCPDFYYCYYGVCEYVPHHDGSWNYDCYSNEECGLLEVCDVGYCESLDAPGECAGGSSADPLLDIPVAGLELSFANAGDSPGSELVVLTPTTVEVYAAGSDIPVASDHEFEAESVLDMVVGELDLDPGEDLAVLAAGQPELVSGDGQGGFTPAGPLDTTLDEAQHLLAVELDGVPPEDLVSLGTQAAAQTTEGLIVWDMGEAFTAANGRDAPGEAEGLSLLSASRVWIMGPTGSLETSVVLLGSEPSALTTLEWDDEGTIDVVSSGLPGWTAFQAFTPNPFPLGSWGVAEVVTDMLGGDFDGDGLHDLAYVIEGEVYIHRDVADLGCVEPEPLGLPLGSTLRDWDAADFDGDGDDDLALLLFDDRLMVFDAGV